MFDCNGARIWMHDDLCHPMHGVFLTTHVFEKGELDIYFKVPAPIGYVHAVNITTVKKTLSSFSYDQATIDKEGVFRVKTWKEMAKETLELRNVEYRFDTLAGMLELLIPSIKVRLESENEGRQLENHPICKIFCSYMSSRVGLEASATSADRLAEAWEQIKELAK